MEAALVPVIFGGARGASLDLRFADTGNLGGLVTFTRASQATYRDSTGTRQTAAIDAPRFDHTTAGVPLGLLIEEARTNLLLNSATLATQDVTVTAVAHTLSFEGTGTVTLTGTSTAGPLVGTGASNRVSLTFTPTAGTLTLTVSGSVTAAQLEIGSFGTSWVPTTGATATRSPDVALITGAVFSSAFNQSASTFAWEFMTSAAIDGFVALSADDGTLSNRYSHFNSRPFYVSGGANVFTPTTAVPAALTATRDAVAAAANDFAWSRNGAAAETDSAGALPVGVNQFQLGRTGTGTLYLNGWLRRIRYFPQRLSNTQLRTLSA